VIELLKGSIVCGKSGKPLQVLAIDGEKVVVKSGEDLLRVDRSKILQVQNHGHRDRRSTKAEAPNTNKIPKSLVSPGFRPQTTND
jgi:hypothetical protein